MAHYVRFEVYLPTRFKDATGLEKSITDQEIGEFCEKVRALFGGYTESSPVATPPFKGWWVTKGAPVVDFLIFIFTLVKLEREEEAKKFFEKWKRTLEERLSQEVILITFYPIQILGDI